QGLMVAPGNPLALHDLGDVVERKARFVHRQQGSGTRLLADHLLAERGLADAALVPADTPDEDSHLAVAAAVAAGAGDCALGIEAAARSFGLDFVPLTEEEYFLLCLTPTLEQPAVQALRRLLQQDAWPQRLATLPGYRSAHAGEVLSLTRALPWWHFRTPRKPRVARK
ncbi:MAG: substrate-binding domain-containing protein, partial [Burkholderiales bacterium]|nr:substrate-binding domain-containing protein [Burkholderiales bacterium]